MSYSEIIDINFIIIFFVILFFNILILNYRYKIANYLKIIDLPNERKIHNEPTPLIGGISYFLTLLSLLFYIFITNEISTKKFITLISIYSMFFFYWTFR